MATATLNTYLSSLMQNTQTNEIEIKRENRFSPYHIYLESAHYDFVEYHSSTSQLLYCFAGKCEIVIGEKSISLGTGNVLLIEKGTNYEVKGNKDSLIVKFKLNNNFSWKNQLELVAANITPNEQKLIDLVLKKLEKDKVFLFITTSVMWSSQSLQDIVQDYINNAPFSGTIGLDLIKIIILRNLREQNFKVSERKENTFKDKTLDQYIDQHYNNISLAQAAEYFGFNRNYFSTMIKEKTGKSFVEHVDDRRMREARRLLAQPNVSLKEIIETIGYSSKSFFYKKFKHYYGVTPAEMRKSLVSVL